MDLAVRGLIVAVPGCIAVFFLLFLQKKTPQEIQTVDLFTTHPELLYWFFIIIFISSISLLIISPYRSLYYFLMLSLLASTIAVQILSKNLHPEFILIEIILFMLNIILGVTLKYPFYFGFTDIAPIIDTMQVTALSGHVIPPDFDLSYTNFPLYHILIAESSLMMNLDIHTTFFLVSSIVYVAVMVILFKIVHFFLKNVQFALFTCLLYSCTSIVITYGTYVVPRVMAFLGFLILLYLSLKRMYEKDTWPFFILQYLLVCYIILVHQVSIFQILSLLVFLLGSEWLMESHKTISPLFLATFFTISLSYWFFIATEFFRVVVQNSKMALMSESLSFIRPSIQAGNELDYLFTNIDSAIMVLLIFIGLGYLLWNWQDRSRTALGFFGLVMLPFYIPNPLQLLWTSLVLFRADRMMLLLAPFFSIIMGIGVYSLISQLERRKYRMDRVLILIFIVIFLFAFFSLTSNNAPDSKDLPWRGPRRHFNQQEIDSYTFAFRYIPYGSQLYSDYYTNRYFLFKKNFSEAEELNIPYFSISPMALFYNGQPGSGFHIFRYSEFLDEGLYYETQIQGYYPLFPASKGNIDRINQFFQPLKRIYDNGATSIH
jgi:hypothetical protein